MTKDSGIRALKNLKNKIAHKNPPVKTQRVVVSSKSPHDDMDSFASAERGFTRGAAKPSKELDRQDYLEETPAATAADAEKCIEKAQPSPDSAAKPVEASRFSRSGRKKKGFVFRATGMLRSFFQKKKPTSKTSDALSFAANNKRLGKKGRRNRMIWVYAGTGVVSVAVLLIIFLAPGGIAAPAEAEVTGAGNQSAVDSSSGAVSNPAVTPYENQAFVSPASGALAVVPTATPQATMTPTVVPAVLLAQIPTTDPGEEMTPVSTTKPDPTPVPVNVSELVDDYAVDADAYYNEMGYSSNHYEYTSNEYYMLAQIIDIEARGESFEGKVAVGNVVLNRVLCRSFPGSTITEVITRPGQFAYAGREDRKPASSSKRAARAVLDDQLWVVPQDIYYFRSGAAAGENWGSHKFYKKIGGHCFYRHSYSGRHRGGDAPPELFNRTFKYAQYGCKPEDRVYRIQYMLNKLGYDVKADKYFGEDTKVELMKFQEKKGLEADGVAGPSTVKALIKAFGVEDYYYKFRA